MPKTFPMQQARPGQPKPAQRSPAGVLQPFCLRCGSSRCRDVVAHAGAKRLQDSPTQ
jgi:hypothetical protein